MKKIIFVSLICLLSLGAVFAGGKTDTVQSGPSKVTLWYLWGGAEGEHVEAMIAKFNASQNRYKVEGLSVPDQQKIQVAIAAGDGPDITDTFSSLTVSYAKKGILEPLNRYIKRDAYDMTDFMPSAIEGVSVDNEIYALPISVNLMMLYYNKDLLAKAAYSNPPSTEAELIKYANALTSLDASGNMLVQGFPDFPEVYYIEHMAFALGGNYGKPGALKLNDPATRLALQMSSDYRKKYGIDKVLAFNSSGGYMSAADPFITGRQALRIDGPWFGTHISNTLGLNLNYGVAPIPYASSKPGSARSGQVQSSTFFIPSNAKNKEGAWAFMSWLVKAEQMAELSVKMGWIPARISALDNPVFDSVVNFKAFADQARSKNLSTFPAFESQQEFQKIISDMYQAVMLGNVGIDEAIANAQKKSDLLK
ncbi:ABC transporter substrate-binding protein [Treponema sp.]